MTKRQYIFLLLSVILLYLSYIILKNEYNNYIFGKYVESQNVIINQLKDYVATAESMIEYKKTTAYKTLVLKQQQNYKLKGETVINLTHEDTYNTFSTQVPARLENFSLEKKQESITMSMTNFEKWMFFLFKKDTR